MSLIARYSKSPRLCRSCILKCTAEECPAVVEMKICSVRTGQRLPWQDSLQAAKKKSTELYYSGRPPDTLEGATLTLSNSIEIASGNGKGLVTMLGTALY